MEDSPQKFCFDFSYLMDILMARRALSTRRSTRRRYVAEPLHLQDDDTQLDSLTGKTGKGDMEMPG